MRLISVSDLYFIDYLISENFDNIAKEFRMTSKHLKELKKCYDEGFQDGLPCNMSLVDILNEYKEIQQNSMYSNKLTALMNKFLNFFFV